MEFSEDSDAGCCSRVSGCMAIAALITMIGIGIITFVIALNRPLYDVEIKHIQNVLATEQELMLDLHVRAVNPNLFAITVNDLDVNLFAESPYVGATEDWRSWVAGDLTSRSGRRRRGLPISVPEPITWPPIHRDDGVDEGTDPIEEPEPGSQKMLLGRIFEFDSPLVFDAAPIHRILTSSVGEIRLAKPGNKTEVGGSVRWERVLQHPFDLIVRGVIKYQLPLSSKTRSAKIAARVTVPPESDGDGDGDNLPS